ncbi:exosome complex component RRP43-like [Onthophagus taurus]|uniref:exosome complex component RRP43-like n=1 Tax=Onthophagus taurus TaxID=166361 RepID=UPI000C204738|nr:exosome complex component RRP43-like [Onthophagus taurus]
MAKQYKYLHPLKYHRDYVAHGVRPDGREFNKFRPVIINASSISTADGSAIAKVGRTTVVCGIKAELCQPKAENPDQGFLIPNVELPPLCSPNYKPGPPSDQAQVTTKAIADVIENSGCISLKSLCICKEKLAWCLYADMICIDHDGAVIDACLIALLTALKTVKLPSVDYNPAIDNKLVNTDEMKPLSINNTPVSTTFAIFDDCEILTDPTHEEENVSTGIITIVIKNEELCSVIKPGGSPISEEDMLSCVAKAIGRGTLITKLIDNAVQETNDEI